MCEKCKKHKDVESKELDIQQLIQFKFDHETDDIFLATGVAEEQVEDMWTQIGKMFMSTHTNSEFVEQLFNSGINREGLCIAVLFALTIGRE